MKVRKDMLAYNWARTQKQDMILVTNALIHSHFFAVELLLLSPAVYVFFFFFGVGGCRDNTSYLVRWLCYSIFAI